jgi:4-hydroxybenzoate polyprenyltransferase
MSSGTVKAFLKLIRLEYSIFSAAGVLISGILAGDLTGVQTEFIILFLIVFFTAAGAFALNDYYDYETDKMNERYDRPLILGLLSRKIAVVTSIISFSIVLFLSFYLNTPTRILVLISLPPFILYNVGLKKIILIKNFIIAYAFMATILGGSLVMDATLEPLIVYFAIMGFIVGTAFEIMIDIGDVHGDKQLGIDTISTRFGLKTAGIVSTFLYGIIMILDPLPFFVLIDSQLYRDYLFLVLILIPVISYIFVSKSLLSDQSPKNIMKLKGQIFLTMQIGSIAYIIGVLL